MKDMLTRILAVMAAVFFAGGCADKIVRKAEPVELEQRLVREIVLRADTSRESVRELSYSEDGRLLGETVFDAGGDVRERIVYTYDGGFLTGRDVYNRAGRHVAKKTYTYTAGGLPESESFFNERGSLTMISRFRYDSRRNRVEWITTNGAGVRMASSQYRYEDGRLSAVFLRGGNGDITMTVSVRYDGDGNRVMETYTNAGGRKEKETTFTYDEYGRLMCQETVSCFRIFQGKTVYEYPGGYQGEYPRGYQGGYQGVWKKPVKISYFAGNGKSVGTIIQEFVYASRPASGSQ
jgi:hypothetical protein